jgi:two-component system heavy metal sensor histidine kinase CusS
MKNRSLSLRLALLIGALGLLQAVGVLALSYFTLQSELDSHQRTVLNDKTEHAGSVIKALADVQGLRGAEPRFTELVAGHAQLHLAIAPPGSEDALLSFGPLARESLRRLKYDTWGSDGFLLWAAPGDARPILSMAVVAPARDGSRYHIVVSADLAEDQRLLSRLLLTAASAAPVALAFVVLSAFVLAKVGLRPLDRFSRAVAHVSTHNLSAVLDPAGLPRELQHLASAFNAMLERVNDGVQRLSDFSSDLAHELRTPLATLLGRTQVSLSRTRTTDELVDVMESNVEELQRLTRLVTDMLFLAQADDAKASLHVTSLDLADESQKVADFLEVLAHERDMTIEVSGSASAKADRELVRRAIMNLLSNAIRHGSHGSTVRITARHDGNMACVEVANEGPAIAAEDRRRLFERFYKVDRSRNRDTGGSGLGLAIVRTIVELHGGTAEVQSNEHTTRFMLRLPRGLTDRGTEADRG